MDKDIRPSWIYPKSIAVATDLTDLDYLLPLAKAQASTTGAMLWLVHVIPPQVYVSPASGAYPCAPKEKAYLDAEEILAKKAAQLEQEGFHCKFEIRRFLQAEQITAFVHERNIDRLIIGTSGRGKLGKLLLGSVAEELIRTIEIPICTIGPHANLSTLTGRKGILFATSLHHATNLGLELAVALASASKQNLTILHVIEHGPEHSAEAIDARIALDDFISSAAINNVRLNSILRFGEPAATILREVAHLQPHLLILGAVPSSNLRAMVRTGVAYEVITKASCPVLTLREPVHATHELREDTEISNPLS
jgi:nucleotide-binding universal stress UspA family protein